MGPAPTPESRPVPPLFKADKGSITFAALPDGKVRLTYASWDDAKVVPAKQVLELCWGRQGVECRIVPKVQQLEPDVDPFYIPDDPPAPFHCPAAKGCKSDVDCSDTRCLPFFAGKTSTISAPPREPRPSLRPDGIPSRADQSLMSPAELAITEAMAVVERAGASIALTDAVVFLSKARERVADHVEARPEPPQQEKSDDARRSAAEALAVGASEVAAS